MRSFACGSRRSESRRSTRSRPMVTNLRRASSAQTAAKEQVGANARLEVAFQAVVQRLEHAAVGLELLALGCDDVLRGALDELGVSELSLGAPDLALDA